MTAWRSAIAAALLAAAAAAQAGRDCEAQPPGTAQVVQSLRLAERTAQWLDASGARVVVLARAGRDLDRWGLRWSHLGWAYRDERGPQPAWRVVHKLNHCGAATSALYRQGLAEFFLDDLHRYRAGIAVPTAEVQARLLPLLADNARVSQLHAPAYNMVAYPWSQRYQQSNQWAIETLALAMKPAADSRENAQAWLRLEGYRPSTLHIDTLTRLGARVGSANIAFDDHPNAQRFAGRIDTVTVDSVFAWLERSGLAGAVVELQP